MAIKRTNKSNYLIFPGKNPLHYLRSGKFVALSSDWKHLKMPLLCDYELIVVTEGTLYLEYMEIDFTVNAGEYLILPPSKSMREGFKKSYCAFYWVHFTADIEPFPAIIDSDEFPAYQKHGCFIIPQTAPIPRFEKIAIEMKQLQDLERNNYPDMTLDVMTTAIIAMLYGQFTAENTLEKDPLGQKQIYSDIADYIKRNISKNIKIGEIADTFGYSPKYLSHLFSEIHGSSLKQFVISQKMDTACFLLTDSNKSITEIASAVGFSDVHNFSRTFKATIGLTPSNYRNTFAKRLLYHV
ncbi:AraC-type DNA-binding protein [Butyrivibrio sp. YAB3001]|nr:AraC-type DNA-binding protein [Butyrivibrio sp. YAB3001]